MNLSDYQNQFNKLISRKKKINKFDNIRKDSFSKFLNIGMPTQKWEDYRFTNLSKLKKEKFDISEIYNDSNNKDDLHKYDIKDVVTFIFINGHYQKEIKFFLKA